MIQRWNRAVLIEIGWNPMNVAHPIDPIPDSGAGTDLVTLPRRSVTSGDESSMMTAEPIETAGANGGTRTPTVLPTGT